MELPGILVSSPRQGLIVSDVAEQGVTCGGHPYHRHPRSHPDHGHLVGNMRTSEPLPEPTLPDLASTESPGALHTLFLATGGAGGSWPRCVLPFGALAVLAGAAGTGITFSLCGLCLDLVQSMSLAAFGAGLGLLSATFLCGALGSGGLGLWNSSESPGHPKPVCGATSQRGLGEDGAAFQCSRDIEDPP